MALSCVVKNTNTIHKNNIVDLVSFSVNGVSERENYLVRKMTEPIDLLVDG